MLAKQCGRLLHYPDSPCSWVLKAKYFPSSTILQAKPRSGISYTWRSILNRLEVLKTELIWRAGNGESIKIWDDPWIPGCSTRRPSTSRGQNLLSRVADLIDPYTGSWDEQLVQQTFDEENVKAILAIPVHTELDDVLAWCGDSRGLFSVKSAYKVQKLATRQ